ncbi:hypothetical protein T4D_5563 [Trichinella pseudospiralis]|uniref:Uncharacterized protein n=1 Tax=Trichinella pseudospiralis TaxID=6337 RepID=A0A0V1FCX5_TRIPS|nr:hypothetical protein T4D_5563 [Trichinella pseudospiralis]
MAKSASTMVSDTSVICPLEFVQRRCLCSWKDKLVLCICPVWKCSYSTGHLVRPRICAEISIHFGAALNRCGTGAYQKVRQGCSRKYHQSTAHILVKYNGHDTGNNNHR